MAQELGLVLCLILKGEDYVRAWRLISLRVIAYRRVILMLILVILIASLLGLHRFLLYQVTFNMNNVIKDIWRILLQLEHRPLLGELIKDEFGLREVVRGRFQVNRANWDVDVWNLDEFIFKVFWTIWSRFVPFINGSLYLLLNWQGQNKISAATD